MTALPPPLPQDSGPTTVSPGAWGWLGDLAARPGLVETILALAAVAAGLLLWWRAARLFREARRRRAVSDYLLGVEQAQSGDLRGALRRLQRVLAEDPENNLAQMLLGKVLAESGEPAKAHRHHLTLQRAFRVESAQNDLLLARCLLELGHPAEAADVAWRAAQAEPGSPTLWEFLFRARLQAGDATAAAAAGQRWLGVLRDPAQAPAARGEVAAALARSGSRLLWAGDRAAARIALSRARALAPDLPEVAVLGARVLAEEHGTEASVAALLGDGEGAPAAAAAELLPVPSGVQLPALAQAANSSPALQALARLLPRSRWRCEACLSELPGRVAVCPTCGARDRAAVGEPLLFEAMESPGRCMDAIEQNRAHIRRTVQRALTDADAAVREQARAEVLAMGDRAVAELLGEAFQRGADSPALDLLREMGPAITPALFAAADELEQRRLLPLPGRSPLALVGQVVQGFDRRALPHFESLFASARAEHRRVLIDYFLGLGDPAEFQIVLERFPPLEILQRMNHADPAVLRRFLQAVPAGHFVAQGLIPHGAFRREEEVVAAITGAAHPEALEAALTRRGPSRTLNSALIEALADPALRPVARRILERFGGGAMDAVLEAYVDPEYPDVVRAELRGLLAGSVPEGVERICAAFGPEPSSLDDPLREALVAMGAPAIDSLTAAYGRRDWLERLSGGFLQRHSNRRAQIANTLAAIGGPAAADALQRLRREEADANLRLRLEQALHRAQAGDNGGRG